MSQAGATRQFDRSRSEEKLWKRSAHIVKKLQSDSASESPEAISHGICRSCLDTIVIGGGKSLEAFLDQFSEPVFVVDGNVRVVTANSRGLAMLVKDIRTVRGEMNGNVFGCIHADDPGGCGETVHCHSCAIRNAVTQVLETGQLCIEQSVCQELDTVIGPRNVRFLISAEKAGNAVLLRIDEAKVEAAVALS